MRPEDIFPYPTFRQGQKELADSVYLACKNGQKFVAEAMSGFGKTAAVLAGSMSAAVEDNLDIIYVCRTKRQVLRVLDELNRFSKRLPVRATSLFSKYDYCLLRQKSFGVSPETFKWYCSFQTSNNLCTYFLNVPFNHDKIEELVDNQTSRPTSTSELLGKAAALHVCPYEIARISLARSRTAVTTYHYLLDENSRSILIPSNRPLDKIIVVIDEAHNIREFLSGNSMTTLSFSDIAESIDDSRNLYLPRISSSISEVNRRAIEFCSRSDHWLLDKDSFVAAITAHHDKDWLSDLVFELSTNSGVAWYSVATNRNLPLSIIKLGIFFSTLLSSLDSEDVVLVKSDRELFLTDTSPARRFSRATAGFKSLILLSATINPANLFLRSIGLDSSTVVHNAPMGYKFRIRTVIDCGVTTRFKMRTAEMYSKIASRVAAVCKSAGGSIGVFLPSYTVLESVKDPLIAEIEHITNDSEPRNVLVERPGLTNEDSEEIMNTFKSNHGCVLLAVQGGRFSEGEDFPGDGMDVSIVIGLSLPPPSPTMYAEYRQLEIKNQFNKHQAYMVLSLLPALRKAFQCAGRHVRNPGKVGMVFFMDSRFATQQIVDLMPSWLRDDLVKGHFAPDDIYALTRDFFARAPAL